jgi:acetyltransferase-like isoleucine patch superfamily enzyme
MIKLLLKKSLKFLTFYLNIIYGFLIKLFLCNCGKNFRPGFPVSIAGSNQIIIGNNFTGTGNLYFYANQGKLIIGNNCGVGSNIQFGASAGTIIIGNDVMIASNVIMRAADHGVARNEKMYKQAYTSGSIIIEDDVWIGANAIILKNVTLGKGSVVGAGSVVTKSVEPNAIVAGNPAKLIKYRD